MFKNYLIIAIRNIFRQKLYSAINILGLAIGLAAAILIFAWIQHERSFDKFNTRSDRIYRLVQTQTYTSGPLTTTCMPGPIAKDIREEYPEIVNSFTFFNSSATLRYNDKIFSEYVMFSDPEMFEMLDFNFLRGDPEVVFDDLHSIVLTDEMAAKYFGEEDPMGKIILLNNEHQMAVTGVVETPPLNSSQRFDICAPFMFLENMGFQLDRYGWNSFHVYVELHPETDHEALNSKIDDFILRHKEEPDPEEAISLYLFPLEKIHLHSVKGKGGPVTYVYIFSAIAIFILIIASINYMNLATARSSRRSREIGLRKTIGSNRLNLIGQFLSESFFITFVSAILAIGIAYLLLPSFNQLAKREMDIPLNDPVFIFGLIGIIIFVSLVAGSYPAFYLSSFKPIQALKSVTHTGKGGAKFRRILVVFQFSLAVVLIISTIVVYRQLVYMKTKDLGIAKEEIVYLSMKGNMKESYDVVKHEFLQSPHISNVTRSVHLPFWIGSNSGGLDWEGKDSKDDILIGMDWVGYDYAATLGLSMEEGRFFDESFGTDTAAVVVNRSTVKALGMKDPIGKWMGWDDGDRYKIIGVVEDYHFLPLSQTIDPLMFFLNLQHPSLVFVRVKPENRDAALVHIEEAWTKVYPNAPYHVQSLNDRYDKIYFEEARLGDIFKYFSILAVFITCLGLIGLASFMVEQKTKEIGVRKTYGAGMQQIYLMLTGNFMKWVLLANILAWPLAFYLMKRWLEDYAYHTNLSWWIFGLAALLAIVLALVTVSVQVIRAGRQNPADALRYE
jgi:predicted permease